MANYALIGTVMNNPEERHTKDGKVIANFRMAVNPDKRNKDKKFFVKCVAWEDMAVLVGNGISAKDFVGVNGRITDVEAWAKDGFVKGQVVFTVNEIAKWDKRGGCFVDIGSDNPPSTRQPQRSELPSLDPEIDLPF